MQWDNEPAADSPYAAVVNGWVRLALGATTTGAATVAYAAGVERRHWTLREATLPVLAPGSRPQAEPTAAHQSVLAENAQLRLELAAAKGTRARKVARRKILEG